MDAVQAERHQVAAPLSAGATAALAGHDAFPVEGDARRLGDVAGGSGGRGAVVAVGAAATAAAAARDSGGQVETDLEGVLHCLKKKKKYQIFRFS